MLPSHEACTGVNDRNSFGLFVVLRPVKAAMTIVGNATDNPMSSIRQFFAVLAKNYEIQYIEVYMSINEKLFFINIYIKYWYLRQYPTEFASFTFFNVLMSCSSIWEIELGVIIL